MFEVVNKTFEDKLRDFIEKQVLAVMKVLMPRVLEEFHKPDYSYWGRYLSPAEAATYCGFKSGKGLRSFCSGRYEPKKHNERVVRYDREALDALMNGNPIEDYLKQLG